MSDTFKYLSQTGTEDEPAQEFLKKYTDRYTPEQQARLEANGGASTANQTKYNTVVTNQDAIDSASKGSDEYRGFSSDSDSGRNYSSGAWGSGDLDAAGLAKKYNLDNSKEARGDGHIWGRNPDGSEVYIGKSSMDLAANDELISNHSKQAGDEVDHSGVPESLSSLGDIKGAILTEWKGADATKTDVPEAIKEDVPIEYSPEIQQAQERVATYQNDIMSGKTTDDIFSNAESKVAPSFDATKGAAGIGTPKSGDSLQKATEATDSFLQNKKFDVKDKYQFQAQ